MVERDGRRGYVELRSKGIVRQMNVGAGSGEDGVQVSLFVQQHDDIVKTKETIKRTVQRQTFMQVQASDPGRGTSPL